MHDDSLNTSRWRILGRSVIGASHTRSDKPNQDALGWRPEAGAGTTAILAVADGHGSAKCFRSERGSRLAVETALEEIAALLEGQGDASAVKRVAQERLPQTLVRRWRQRVDDDLAQEPLSDAELDALGRTESAASRRLVAEQPALAYGSTLLVAAVTPQFLLYVQIGDGDILCVSDAGDVSRPVAGDARLVANETTSLCTAEAWKDFRVTFQALSGAPPALILLSSDGYANSFQNETAFLQVGHDLHAMVASDGLDVVADNLEVWLAQASREGSGDDVTLGILARADFERSAPPGGDVREAVSVREGGPLGTSVRAAETSVRGAETSVRPRVDPDRSPTGLRTFSLRDGPPAQTSGGGGGGRSRRSSGRRSRQRAARQRLIRLGVFGAALLAAAIAAVALGVWAFRALHPPKPGPHPKPVPVRRRHSPKPHPPKPAVVPKKPATIPVDSMIPPATPSPPSSGTPPP